MLNFLATFWYCYDDMLAEALDIPQLGEVNPLLWLFIWLVTCMYEC